MQLFKPKTEAGWVLLRLLASAFTAGIILFGMSLIPVPCPFPKHPMIYWGIMWIVCTLGGYLFMPIGEEYSKK